MTSATAVIIRQATAADHGALARLASLDSNAIPAGAVLVAEEHGEILAAVSIQTGQAISDPFRPTAELVSLLHYSRGSKAAPRSARVNVIRRLLSRRATPTTLAYS